MKFNLMMHNALMVERTMLGVEDYEIPANLEELTINQNHFSKMLKHFLYPRTVLSNRDFQLGTLCDL